MFFHPKRNNGGKVTYNGSEIAKLSDLPSVMIGATAGDAGTDGLVPAPAAGDQDKYLKGDGTWSTATASAAWGAITGTLSDQTDLQSALNAKQDTLTAGTNINITGSTISATDTTYTGSDGITLTGTNFTNSGVRAIASGTANGTISVNTNGTSADVAVTGLGSAAYTASTDYATAAQGTKADTAVQSLSDLGITASAAEINVLDGITADTTELNYVDGVTSSIQNQLDNKQGLLGGGTSGTLLTNSGTPGTVSATSIDATPTDGSNNPVSSDGVYDALAGKVSTGHELIAYQNPTAGNNYTWYRKYVDGWVEQGRFFSGSTTVPYGGQGDLGAFVFPIPMANSEYSAAATGQGFCVLMSFDRNTTSCRPIYGAYTVDRTLTNVSVYVCGKAAS